MSCKKSNNQNKNFTVNIMLCSKKEQENFKKVSRVLKMIDDYPNMSLTSAIAHCGTTFPTFKRYKEICEKMKISELI